MAHLIRSLSKRLPKNPKASSTDLFEEELSSLYSDTNFDNNLELDNVDELKDDETPSLTSSYSIHDIIKGKFKLLRKKEDRILQTNIMNFLNSEEQTQETERNRPDISSILCELNSNKRKSDTTSMDEELKAAQERIKEIREMRVKETVSNVRKQNQVIRNEDKAHAVSHYVTEQTLPASSASEVRGVLAAAHFAMISYRKRLNVFKGKFFTCDYFPPEHALGRFRKSKPAIKVHYLDGYTANNPDIKIDKNQLAKSLTPSDYASIRSKWRRLLRNEFFEQYQDANGRDGYYAFAVSLFPKPKDMDALRIELRTCIENTKKVETTPFIKAANSVVDWRRVSRVLGFFGISAGDPPIGVKTGKKPLKQITNEEVDIIKQAFEQSKQL